MRRSDNPRPGGRKEGPGGPTPAGDSESSSAQAHQEEQAEVAGPFPLTASHDVDRFSCEAPELTTWLQRSAINDARMGTSRTRVLLDGTRVVGYFALSSHTIRVGDLPKKLARGRDEESSFPAQLLAKLARCESWKGRGLGGRLLEEALRVAVEAADLVGARILVVDALDEKAARFYEKYGFKRLDTAADRPRLYMKLSDIRATLDAADEAE